MRLHASKSTRPLRATNYALVELNPVNKSVRECHLLSCVWFLVQFLDAFLSPHEPLPEESLTKF